MTISRRPKKKVIFLAIAVLVFAASVYFVARGLSGAQSPGSGTTKPSKSEVGIYLDGGNLWQWAGGRKTQLTKTGTIVTFDWHPAGGEVVYVTHEEDEAQAVGGTRLYLKDGRLVPQA